MKRFIKINGGRPTPFSISEQETVKDLKLKVKNKTQIPVEAQKLFNGQSELTDELLLSALKLEPIIILDLHQTIVNS